MTMASKELHVIAFILGHTTSWFRVTVPRASVFGDARPEFLSMLFDEITGTDIEQAIKIARLAREVQGLTYMEGPALIIEDVPLDDELDAESIMAIRIIAMLDMLKYQKQLDYATITLQPIDFAESVDDKVLKRAGMLVQGEEFRDAARHCIVALRRARDSDDVLGQMWPEYRWNPGHGWYIEGDNDED